MEVMNILSDFNTGLTVNSRLIREGKHIRMAEIYLVTPKGDKLSVTEDGVTIINVNFTNTYTFDKARDIRPIIYQNYITWFKFNKYKQVRNYRTRSIPYKAIDVQRPDVLVVSRPDHKNDNIHIYVIGTEGHC